MLALSPAPSAYWLPPGRHLCRAVIRIPKLVILPSNLSPAPLSPLVLLPGVSNSVFLSSSSHVPSVPPHHNQNAGVTSGLTDGDQSKLTCSGASRLPATPTTWPTSLLRSLWLYHTAARCALRAARRKALLTNLSLLPRTRMSHPPSGRERACPSLQYSSHSNVLVQFRVSLLTGLSFSGVRT